MPATVHLKFVYFILCKIHHTGVNLGEKIGLQQLKASQTRTNLTPPRLPSLYRNQRSLKHIKTILCLKSINGSSVSSARCSEVFTQNTRPLTTWLPSLAHKCHFWTIHWSQPNSLDLFFSSLNTPSSVLPPSPCSCYSIYPECLPPLRLGLNNICFPMWALSYEALKSLIHNRFSKMSNKWKLSYRNLEVAEN